MSAPILSITAPLQRGDSGPLVKLVQEWLSFALADPYPARIDSKPLACAIDGDFGPGTEAAVRRFQRGSGLLDSGVVDPFVFARLVAPMVVARAPVDPVFTGRELGRTVVAAAAQHLSVGAREVGGDNRGPWVRLYCGGAEGLPWCAGFASTVVGQAAVSLQVSVPFAPELACDLLARDAERRGALVHGGGDAPPVGLKPGSLFLLRSPPGADRKWHHTGIVADVQPGRVVTLEGNTDDDGSPNGFAVFRRTRGYSGLDFIALEAT